MKYLIFISFNINIIICAFKKGHIASRIPKSSLEKKEKIKVRSSVMWKCELITVMYGVRVGLSSEKCLPSSPDL